MVSVPPQLSVATTAASSNAGTAEAQLTVVLPGMLVIAGGVISFTVMVCIRDDELPHTSVAV